MIEDMLEDLGFEERDGLFERGWDDSSILVRILGDSVRLTWVDEHHGREVLEEVSLEMPEFDTEATEELERLAVAADYFDEHGRKPPHGRKLQGLSAFVGTLADVLIANGFQRVQMSPEELAEGSQWWTRDWARSYVFVAEDPTTTRINWISKGTGRGVPTLSLIGGIKIFTHPEYERPREGKHPSMVEYLNLLMVLADGYDEGQEPDPRALALRGFESDKIVKRCGCGRTYTQEQWGKLKPLGIQVTEEAGVRYFTSMANCVCGSTIATERQEPM